MNYFEFQKAMLNNLLNHVRNSNVSPDKKNHLENFFAICMDLDINTLEGPFSPEECDRLGIEYIEGEFSYFLENLGLQLISKHSGCVDVAVMDNKDSS